MFKADYNDRPAFLALEKQLEQLIEQNPCALRDVGATLSSNKVRTAALPWLVLPCHALPCSAMAFAALLVQCCICLHLVPSPHPLPPTVPLGWQGWHFGPLLPPDLSGNQCPPCCRRRPQRLSLAARIQASHVHVKQPTSALGSRW